MLKNTTWLINGRLIRGKIIQASVFGPFDDCIDDIFSATVDLQEALEMSQLRMHQVSDFNAFFIVSVVMIYRLILTVIISDNINAVHDKFLVREAHDQEQDNLKKKNILF
jgi:hypothetical protein